MKILAIDTSCDETATAVTEGTKILSNIIWSQASLHANFGGVMPSLAQRMHRERINFVIRKALITSHQSLVTDIDAVAVTVGPGLAIALGVGIEKAKEIAKKYKKKIIPVNHVEAHLLSSFASPITNHQLPLTFPAFGLVVSGGNTQLIYIEKIGKYKVLAQTVDDALGEALDKGARLLGLGYPGGAILEKFAHSATSGQARYNLPIPLADDKIKNRFSYSGLKTAMYRLIEKEKPLTKEKICNLAASFQDVAFNHIINVLKYQIETNPYPLVPSALLLGGGVANNNLLRSKLRKLLKPYGITLHVPYSKKLCGDNAAMIGVSAYLKTQRGNLMNTDQIDRSPNLKI